MTLKNRTYERFLLTFCIVTLCSASGCAQLTQAEIKALETREMDCSYDHAYQAAANGLFSLGFTISHSDKNSGILTGTRLDPNTGAKVAAAVFFGVIGLLATQDRNEAVTFMLSPLEPNVTQLRMQVVVNGKASVDHKLMTAIWQQIEREAMLESRPSDRTPTTKPADDGATEASAKRKPHRHPATGFAETAPSLTRNDNASPYTTVAVGAGV